MKNINSGFWITEADPLGIDLDRKTLNQLSPGLQSRLHLAFTLVKTKATVIFADEALSHMDKTAQGVWIHIMNKYAHDHGKIILMAEKEIVTNSEVLDGVLELKNEEIRMSGNNGKKLRTAT